MDNKVDEKHQTDGLKHAIHDSKYSFCQPDLGRNTYNDHEKVHGNISATKMEFECDFSWC